MSERRTTVSIQADQFLINGQPTYPGREFNGMKIEGLLLNARLVQGTFDDLNPQTRERWAYPDGRWDPQRNTDEFIAAMPSWKAAGLVAFTLNLQGGSPEGYSKTQPWHNSAFTPEGELRSDFFARLEQILDAADSHGMAVILGLFYFGQDQRLHDEQAVVRATELSADWVVEKGYRNVLLEIANEFDVGHYDHEILTAPRCHELVQRVQERTAGRLATPAGRLLASTSTRGGTLAPSALAAAADFILLHGNHVESPAVIRQMVVDTRALPGYAGQPILFNEDDHFDFEAQDNHFLAAVSEYAGWGYFDYRDTPDAGYHEGFQSVPVDWSIGSPRKKSFFALLSRIAFGK